jgi:UDP-N-acetylmuramoyl-L-alanyl-D-glutamate--2,6-diaminopimelate ligase
VSFSQRVMSTEVHAENVRYEAHGTEWILVLGSERFPVRLPLIGEFNVSNALAAAAAVWAIGMPAQRIAERLSNVPQVPGRLEVLHEHPTVLRDYSHKPDALDRALDAVRPFVKGRLILVFGCGGDRDRGKRPEMGAIAERKADFVILTSDNPRTEDPESILDDIERGMRPPGSAGGVDGGHRRSAPHERIEDRRRAIERALEIALPQDLVMLAGKGHETYQVRGTTKYPFDEKIIVSDLFAKRP